MSDRWYQVVEFRNTNPRTGYKYQMTFGPYENQIHTVGPAHVSARKAPKHYGLIKRVSSIRR